jgi:hypothetical protein
MESYTDSYTREKTRSGQKWKKKYISDVRKVFNNTYSRVHPVWSENLNLFESRGLVKAKAAARG